MDSSNEKGSVLELVVHTIEEAILSTFPEYQEDTFTIESRKIIRDDGVRHEIDLWVCVDRPKGYTSVFIFECKNWKKKVGKNEVIAFSAKIEAAQAQTGYLVAKAFTADAEAQCKKHTRMQLVPAKETVSPSIPIPNKMHGVEPIDTQAGIRIHRRYKRREGRILDQTAASCQFNGENVNLTDYGRRQIETCIREEINAFPSDERTPGTYRLKDIKKVISYDKGELVVNGDDVEFLEVQVTGSVRVFLPRIISYWDIERRGRALIMELPTTLCNPINVTIASVSDDVA